MNVPDNLQFQLSDNHFGFCEDMVIYARDPVSKIVTCATITLRQMENGALIPSEARIPMSPQSLANLMTCLWAKGIRPEGYKGTEGEVKRLEDNLRDQRYLVGELLPIVLSATKNSVNGEPPVRVNK